MTERILTCNCIFFWALFR